jgi:hypothetical protein
MRLLTISFYPTHPLPVDTVRINDRVVLEQFDKYPSIPLSQYQQKSTDRGLCPLIFESFVRYGYFEYYLR